MARWQPTAMACLLQQHGGGSATGLRLRRTASFSPSAEWQLAPLVGLPYMRRFTICVVHIAFSVLRAFASVHRYSARGFGSISRSANQY